MVTFFLIFVSIINLIRIKMKKLLLLLVFLLTVSLNAQTAYLKSTTTGKTIDTISGSTSRTQKLEIKGYQDVLTVQAVFTRISGTAGGTATLYGSTNGTNWVPIGSAFTVTNVASQTNSWSVNPSIWQYYQITYAGTGTMSVAMTTPVIYRSK